MVSEPLFIVIVGKRALAGDCAANLEIAYVVTSRLSRSASAMHLAAISVDNFLAVIFPLRHVRIMKNHGLKTMLIVDWSAAFVFVSLRMLFLKETNYLVSVAFLVSYFLISVCYL